MSLHSFENFVRSKVYCGLWKRLLKPVEKSIKTSEKGN